jgi:sec1 family domain-containing protein 1
MLNFNRELDTAASDGLWSSDWKVLVYDAFGRDVIAPLFNVAELRRQGVTLHLMLDAARDGIPDVPAIYFVSPTDEAIRRIAADAGDGLYSKMYVNFVSPAPRALLESLARATIANNSVASISKLFDQFLGFVCVEPSLFSLNMCHSFVSYNDPRAADAQVSRK